MKPTHEHPNTSAAAALRPSGKPVAIDLTRGRLRTGPAILVGTRATCALLQRQLILLDSPPETVGGVEIDGSADPIAALERLCSRTSPRFAIVSLPQRDQQTAARVSAALGRLGIEERRVSPLDEAVSGRSIPQLIQRGPSFDPQALIGRAPREIDRSIARSVIEGRRVLITGAGGSIGSEIARTVAALNPSALVLVERSENALFEIDRRLGATRPTLDRTALLHDVVDGDGTRSIFERHRPAVIFHAAAHKHVPLMEEHPAHAFINNVIGTRSVADAAVATGAERFVLISSDKAVNPSSVMGATKRLAEMLVHAVQSGATEQGARTRLAMVRFGNVLGSAGSVLPVWSAQIAEGGPVTVTDERMTRYFMTIPEAAALVVQAAGLTASGASPADTFVLDMGEPVNIAELASRFVRAAGAEPVTGRTADPQAGEIELRITGARPGEKLTEELAYDVELLEPTKADGVRALRTPDRVDATALMRAISDFAINAGSLDAQGVIHRLGDLVPAFAEIRRRRAA
ncbi:MAG: polysaccharide biosynthesis protein [Planctomycetota bacterium]